MGRYFVSKGCSSVAMGHVGCIPSPTGSASPGPRPAQRVQVLHRVLVQRLRLWLHYSSHLRKEWQSLDGLEPQTYTRICGHKVCEVQTEVQVLPYSPVETNT